MPGPGAAARAASAARIACNPLSIRDVKGKKRTSTNFAFFGGEMCRVPAGAVSVPLRAVPCRAAVPGAARAPRGTSPMGRHIHGPRPAGSRPELSPWGCGGVRVSVRVCARSPRGRPGQRRCRRAGRTRPAHGRPRGSAASETSQTPTWARPSCPARLGRRQHLSAT